MTPRVSGLPEPGVYCVEEDCSRLAMSERPVAVTRDGELVTELVCDDHALRAIKKG